MQYMLMIHWNQEEDAAPDAAAQAAMFAAYGKFTQGIVEEGIFVGGDALHPPTTATTLRVRDGRRITTDGPFAETKEQLGGYYLLDVPDLDAALAVAARIPHASSGGCVEVRPVLSAAEISGTDGDKHPSG